MTRGGQPESEGTPAVSPAPRDIIRLSEKADQLIEQWAFDLAHDRIQFWQLPSGLQAFWTLAYDEGRASRNDELNQLAADRDRYYQRAFNPPQWQKPGPSLAELERIRGNPENADRIDQLLDHLFSNFGAPPTPPEDRTTT